MKPEVLLTSRMLASVAPNMDEHFTVHRLIDAEDKEAFVAKVAAGVRAIATDGGVGASAALMEKLPKLEIVACCGVGVDAVDLAYAAKRGIAVTNTPDVLNDDVANLGVILLLAASRRLVFNDRWVREGKWLRGSPPLARSVRGKTVGILGLGRIGKSIAEKLQPFGCRIVYHGRKRQAEVEYEYFPDLVAMARASDYLVVICPGGEATRNLVNAEVLEALGPEGTLINIARGSVVDEPALIAALKSGKLGCAALDVFADEPRVPQELIGMEHVILQPHMGSATLETRRAMGELTVNNLIAHFAGKPLLTPVA